MAAERADQLATNAGKAKSITVAGETIVQHGIADQIAADKYARSASARTKGKLGGGITMQRMRSPGAGS